MSRNEQEKERERAALPAKNVCSVLQDKLCVQGGVSPPGKFGSSERQEGGDIAGVLPPAFLPPSPQKSRCLFLFLFAFW